MKTKHTPGPWVITRTDKEDDFPEVMVGIPDTREARRDYSLNWAGRTVAQVFNQFGEEYDANARLIAAAPEMHDALCHLLEWAKGNRGRNDVNPYSVPEVKCALQVLAGLQGRKDYLDAETDIGVLPADERTNRLHHRPA